MILGQLGFTNRKFNAPGRTGARPGGFSEVKAILDPRVRLDAHRADRRSFRERAWLKETATVLNKRGAMVGNPPVQARKEEEPRRVNKVIRRVVGGYYRFCGLLDFPDVAAAEQLVEVSRAFLLDDPGDLVVDHVFVAR
jgi:hypothetical protein